MNRTYWTPSGETVTKVTEYEYDEQGRVVRETVTTTTSGKSSYPNYLYPYVVTYNG